VASKTKKGKSLCIFSAKGGVGKTITTLNLAGIFKAIGKKVLIIDLDLSSGGIAVALNIETNKDIFQLSEDLINNRYNDFKNYVANYDEDIDFIASPKDPRQMTKMEARYIELIIEKASFLYDVILIDTNHFLNDINLLALDMADKILFITTNDPMDLKNLKSLLSIFRDENITKYKVLLNNSKNPYKEFFSEADMKNILRSNIDYILSQKMFIKNIDNYIMNGKIITLLPKMPTTFAKDYATLTTIAIDLLDGGNQNEEK